MKKARTVIMSSSVWSRNLAVCLVVIGLIHTSQADDLYSDSEESIFAKSLEPQEHAQGRSLGPMDNPFGKSLGPVDARPIGARYIGNGMQVKGGWRPVMASGAGPFIPDGGLKMFSGPGHLENKAYNVHGYGGSAHGSTSSRPVSTRDVSKISNIAQTYKPTIYHQNGVNLNAPVNSYLNPFAFTSNAAMNPYKLSPGYHFDNNAHLKQATSHRPLYTKQPQQQLLLGMRVKPNQYQILQQQHPNNHFHQQQLPSYQLPVKRPVDNGHNIYHHQQQTNHQQHQNYQPKPHEQKPIVNPQESLNKQTQQHAKPHQSQPISAVTYKPPMSAHFPQFGVSEDSFAPIPSSILGSFSSFGHASVKARDPPQFNNKNQQSTIEPTKNPEVQTPTKDYVTSSTANTEVKVSKPTTTVVHTYHNAGKDDYKSSLVPPPQINKPTNEVQNGYRDSFIPSPVDPFSKGHNLIDAFSLSTPKQNKYSSTKRPSVSSFFDISPSTISPFESFSTHGIPDNHIVQLPSPQAPFNSFGNQNNKVKIHKDKYQTFSTIGYSPVTTKYNAFDDGHHQFSPQHDLYDNPFNKHNLPQKPSQHGYEVTEGWEPFGEEGTQPSINGWGNPSQTFKQYTSVLGPPYNNKIAPTFYPPIVSSNVPDINSYNDVSTIYSIVSENNQHSYENSLTSPDPQEGENSEQSNKQIVISPSPNYINVNTDKARITTTDIYQDTTTTPTVYSSRRKPSRYRPQQETTTEDFKDVTTRFETNKENAQETANDLTANDLPTIPPNKHFKRPSLTTVSQQADDGDKYKRTKNRRRRPQKTTPPSSDDTTEEIASESVYKVQRERTTTFLPEVEETTKLPRNRLRFPQKTRPTRPSVQPELTSSAQPTIVPTHPVTLRPKLHSRIRITTQSPLDFDETVETTTIRDKSIINLEKQSSIMKIAKESYFAKPPVNKYSSSFGSINDTPDYTHKQDEKDTPTSDVSLYLTENKYSAKKENNISFSDLFMDFDSEVQQSAQDSFLSPTAAQPTEQVETLTTQVPYDGKSSFDAKNNEEVLTPSEGENNKKTKLYGNNRPRFSVKDYRNRLNQYTSSTTEKTVYSTDAAPRLRFPNRAKLANLKDKDYHDSKISASDVENVTDQPKKKFVPKESKHKIHNLNSDKGDNHGLPSSQQKHNSSSDTEFTLKANNKFRSSLRRDPNKLSTATTVVPDASEKSKQAPNIKRPNIIRKRVQIANKTEAVVEPITEATTTTTDKFIIELAIENVTSTEKSTSETAIMKIAKEDKRHSSTESSIDVDLSQRVSDLTLAASKDYDTPGMFKSVSPNSRRVVPNYFTIATDDPILPIEAFFPQLNHKKDS